VSKDFESIIRALPRLREAAEKFRDVLLANLVMIGEIPAPTGGEQARVEFLCQRFTECGLQNCAADEIGNALGVIPGTGDGGSIVLVAHVDTVFSAKTERTVSLRSDKVIGPGVADNSLGLAVLATLPSLLEECGIKPKSDVILVGAVRSLGRGDLEGLRFFLDNTPLPVRVGICVEGAQLGRLSFASNGMVRGQITVTVPEEYDWTRYGTTSAILTLHSVIDAIVQIPIPQRPRTRIIMGSVQAGNAFNRIPTQAVLKFEIRSESAEMVEEIRRNIENIILDVSSRSRAKITLDILAKREPGGMEFGHPLVRCTSSIISELGIEPMISPSISELSAFIARNIPAVTIGISTAENLNEVNESAAIEPISTGAAQLLALLLAVDGGLCDGH